MLYFRSYIYYPFFDNFNFISMASSSIVLFEFFIKLCVGFASTTDAIDNAESRRKFIMLATIAHFCYANSGSFYCSPRIGIVWGIVGTSAAWTTLLAYLLPYFDTISTMSDVYSNNSVTLYWYVWFFTTPCILIHLIISNSVFDVHNKWKELFTEEKHEIKCL